MMRLMRSLVSTQALPVVEFELSTLGLGKTIRARAKERYARELAEHGTEGDTGVEKCLSVTNPLEMKNKEQFRTVTHRQGAQSRFLPEYTFVKIQKHAQRH